MDLFEEVEVSDFSGDSSVPLLLKILGLLLLLRTEDLDAVPSAGLFAVPDYEGGRAGAIFFAVNRGFCGLPAHSSLWFSSEEVWPILCYSACYSGEERFGGKP